MRERSWLYESIPPVCLQFVSPFSTAFSYGFEFSLWSKPVTNCKGCSTTKQWDKLETFQKNNNNIQSKGVLMHDPIWVPEFSYSPVHQSHLFWGPLHRCPHHVGQPLATLQVPVKWRKLTVSVYGGARKWSHHFHHSCQHYFK